MNNIADMHKEIIDTINNFNNEQITRLHKNLDHLRKIANNEYTTCCTDDYEIRKNSKDAIDRLAILIGEKYHWISDKNVVNSIVMRIASKCDYFMSTDYYRDEILNMLIESDIEEQSSSYAY